MFNKPREEVVKDVASREFPELFVRDAKSDFRLMAGMCSWQECASATGTRDPLLKVRLPLCFDVTGGFSLSSAWRHGECVPNSDLCVLHACYLSRCSLCRVE